METFDPSILDVSWDETFDRAGALNGGESNGEEKQLIYKQKPFVQAILLVIDTHDMGTIGLNDIKVSFG